MREAASRSGDGLDSILGVTGRVGKCEDEDVDLNLRVTAHAGVLYQTSRGKPFGCNDLALLLSIPER
jgi:hypothetical protein